MEKRDNKILFGLLPLFIVLFLSNSDSNAESEIINEDTIGEVNVAVHKHFDIKVFVNGGSHNFNQEKYNERNPFVHFHLGNTQGDKVVHIHHSDVNLGFFLKTIDMSIDSECLVIDGTSYCNSNNGILRLFVNGLENFDFENYSPSDLDRILITYGEEEDFSEQLNSVSSFSCIFSHKCPQKEEEALVL